MLGRNTAMSWQWWMRSAQPEWINSVCSPKRTRAARRRYRRLLGNSNSRRRIEPVARDKVALRVCSEVLELGAAPIPTRRGFTGLQSSSGADQQEKCNGNERWRQQGRCDGGNERRSANRHSASASDYFHGDHAVDTEGHGYAGAAAK